MIHAKPFLKWAGGKTQLLNEIRTRYPTELGRHIDKYAEPFLGGGAVLFDILKNYNLKAFYVSDTNRELITTYQVVRDDPDALICSLSSMQDYYWQANTSAQRLYFYSIRQRYNHLKNIFHNPVELASLFIFLNRTCFNGLYRVNLKGEFNVPIGNYNKPLICDAINLQAASLALQKVQIVNSHYRHVEAFADTKTFVYFDPPYRPLSNTANFNSYSSSIFGDKEQVMLAQFIDRLSNKGVFIMASNSDPKNSNADDNFFDEIYANQIITRVNANRMINSIGGQRGQITELLITNYVHCKQN